MKNKSALILLLFAFLNLSCTPDNILNSGQLAPVGSREGDILRQKNDLGENLESAPAIQWHKGHGTDNGDHVHYGLQTSDGGYIIFTDSDTAGAMGENNFGLMKLIPDHVCD